MKFDIEKCRDTFHPWRIYEPSEVTMITKEQLEEEGYQSSYLYYYNYIMSHEWSRVDKKWRSPDGDYNFSKIYDAYQCQKYLEEISKSKMEE